MIVKGLRLCAGLGFLILAGCTKVDVPGTAPNASSPAERTSVAESSLKAVLQRGVLRVGSCLSSAPFGFYDQSGAADGYDVDLAKELAKRMGVKLEVINIKGADRILNIQTGKVDVVICNFTRNLERAKEVAFTDPYVVAGQSLIVRKDSGIKSLQDMRSHSIATVKGSTNGDEVRSLNMGMKIQEYDNSLGAILAVKQGQADAMLEDTNFLVYQAKLNPELIVTDEAPVPLQYNGFGLRQGDQVWLNYLNEFLFEISQSKVNAKLYEKWFGVPPRFALNPQY
ncbi:amino acid ABC transporter substrate-binding protein [Bordetella genomosp. 8]|uniref:Amino acid ABC transporter substrate-binding protein n=1 Tax=Bordetella genomosp. 8 TaxID=1416806 RepID=A0A1W6YPT8_9BORD|nr:transporter substrate-binding domain-containing protein [Bordetella genomosp. 8]ARP83077.1 amino acid ABC transporter substrate-binding protein [Bordetella genomosp. 8]